MSEEGIRPASGQGGDETSPPADIPEPPQAAPLQIEAPPPPPAPVLPPFASLGDRLAAQLVDGLIAFGLLFLIAGALTRHLGGFVGPALDTRVVGAGIAIAATTLIVLLYFIVFEKQLGLTLGKIAAGARVRSTEGGRISGRAAFVRNVVRIMEMLTLYVVSAFLVLVTKRSQRLGDLFAGTIVVRHEGPRVVRVAALLFALLIAVGGVLGGMAMNGVGPVQPDLLAMPGPSPVPSPSASPGRSRIASAILTDSPTSDVSRTTFTPQTPEVFVRFTLADVPPGSSLRATWVAESVAGLANDTRMDEGTLNDVGGTRNVGTLSYGRPPNGWPTGTYRVDLYLSGQFERTLRFTVEPGGAAPTTSPPPASSPVATAVPGTTPSPARTASPATTTPAAAAATSTVVPTAPVPTSAPPPTNSEPSPPGTI